MGLDGIPLLLSLNLLMQLVCCCAVMMRKNPSVRRAVLLMGMAMAVTAMAAMEMAATEARRTMGQAGKRGEH